MLILFDVCIKSPWRLQCSLKAVIVFLNIAASKSDKIIFINISEKYLCPVYCGLVVDELQVNLTEDGNAITLSVD